MSIADSVIFLCKKLATKQLDEFVGAYGSCVRAARETSTLLIYSVFLNHVAVLGCDVGAPGVRDPLFKYAPDELEGSSNRNSSLGSTFGALLGSGLRTVRGSGSLHAPFNGRTHANHLHRLSKGIPTELNPMACHTRHLLS
jgi:hypothetical protein